MRRAGDRPSGFDWVHRSHSMGVSGCTTVSPGCRYCTAAETAHRISQQGKAPEGLTRKQKGRVRWNGRVEVLSIPQLRKLVHALHPLGRQRVLVSSMSDILHEDVPIPYLAELLRLLGAKSSTTWLLLTKRAHRYPELVAAVGEWPSNVWAGVSVEGQRWLEARVGYLAGVPAPVRFLVLEPLLQFVELNQVPAESASEPLDLAQYANWVILGGEIGPHARPLRPWWAASVRDQCVTANVPFWFMRWGSLVPQSQLEGERSRHPRQFPDEPYHRVPTYEERAQKLDGELWRQLPVTKRHGIDSLTEMR